MAAPRSARWPLTAAPTAAAWAALWAQLCRQVHAFRRNASQPRFSGQSHASHTDVYTTHLCKLRVSTACRSQDAAPRLVSTVQPEQILTAAWHRNSRERQLNVQLPQQRCTQLSHRRHGVRREQAARPQHRRCKDPQRVLAPAALPKTQ